MKYFRRSNHEILQTAVRKNMMVSFNVGEHKLHEAMFKQRSIMMVEQEERPEPPAPEPGEPIEIVPTISVEHNMTTGMNYIHFNKKDFEAMSDEEVEELVYQMFNQCEFDHTAQYPIEMIDVDGKPKEIMVQVDAVDMTVEEEEEKEREVTSGESCDSSKEGEAVEKEVADMSKKSKEMKMEVKEMSEEQMMQNPKFKAGNASFQKGYSTSAAKVFKKSADQKPQDRDIKEIAKTQAVLEHAIKGDDGGKSKSISPAKKLNMKAIITESSEKEYITHHGVEGKALKVNLIVDRSGSMSGSPTRSSNILISALNNLSFEYDELDVQVIYSESNAYFAYKLPVDNLNSGKIWSFSRTGSAEGLSRTFDAHFADMKEADINLVYTDGSIMDDAIDKAYMKAQEIELTGLYVNEDFTPEDIMQHVEQNTQYFTRTIIRKDAVGLVNELANMLVMNKYA